MEVMLEPIFCNPKEAANKIHHLKNKSDIETTSLKSADKTANDLTKAQFQIVDIQWQYVSEEINFKPKVVDTLNYINANTYPVEKSFKFAWNTEEEQKTIWSQQWGNEEYYEYEAIYPNSDVPVKITNIHVRSTSIALVPLSITKSLQVSVTPKSSAVAQLVLSVSNIVKLPFIATVKSINVDRNPNEFKVEASWYGTLYKMSSSNINICETDIGIM